MSHGRHAQSARTDVTREEGGAIAWFGRSSRARFLGCPQHVKMRPTIGPGRIPEPSFHPNPKSQVQHQHLLSLPPSHGHSQYPRDSNPPQLKLDTAADNHRHHPGPVTHAHKEPIRSPPPNPIPRALRHLNSPQIEQGEPGDGGSAVVKLSLLRFISLERFQHPL